MDQIFLIKKVMESLAANLKCNGSMMLTIGLDLDEKYLSNDEKHKIQPTILCRLGKFEEYDIYAAIQINWYSPGKIYMGIIASSKGFRINELGSDDNDELRIKILEKLNIKETKQKMTAGWLLWRYLTVDGNSVLDTNNLLIPHFKDLNKSAISLKDEENFRLFLEGARDLWMELLSHKIVY